MAANTQLPPIPNNPITDVFVWRDWFYQVSQVLTQQAAIAWTSLNFTGSNLRDIVTRQHNALQDIQGGIANQYYHLSEAQYTALATNAHNSLSGLQGGTTNQYYHLTSTQYAAVIALTTPSYGAFQNTADQTYAAANTPYIVALNTTDYSNNVTLSANRLTTSVAGMYNLEFSFQLANTDSQIHEFAVWLRKNGSNVAGTSSIASVVSSHGSVDGYAIMSANFYIDMAAGDYVELWSAVSNTGIRIDAIPAQTTPYIRPLNPSSVVTLTQIGV